MRTKTRMIFMRMMVMFMRHHQRVPINSCEEHDRIFARFPTEWEPRETCTGMVFQNQPCWASHQISMDFRQNLHFFNLKELTLHYSSNIFEPFKTQSPEDHSVYVLCDQIPSCSLAAYCYCERGSKSKIRIGISNPQSDHWFWFYLLVTTRSTRYINPLSFAAISCKRPNPLGPVLEVQKNHNSWWGLLHALQNRSIMIHHFLIQQP